MDEYSPLEHMIRSHEPFWTQMIPKGCMYRYMINVHEAHYEVTFAISSPEDGERKNQWVEIPQHFFMAHPRDENLRRWCRLVADTADFKSKLHSTGEANETSDQ